MASEQVEETQSRLVHLNRGLVSGSIAAVGALLVATETRSGPEALLLGGGLAATLVVVDRWRAGRFARGALIGLVITGLVFLVGVLAADAASASYGFAIAATIAAFELPRHRRPLFAGIAIFAGAVIAVKVLTSPSGEGVDTLLRYGVTSLCVAGGGSVLVILSHAMNDLVGELDKAREREAETAVMRERVRFAGDLHDIQGHTLHVVKLKVALAKRLLRTDLDRAAHELDEVHDLVAATIAQTKELAYAQRRLNLSAELENAKNLFEAAGIGVGVERRGEVDPRVGEALGQVLRETTTNILRHADAAQVWITLTETGISVANDGVRPGEAPRLSGLATLRDRLAAQGGDLTVHQADGVFSTTASFPRRDDTANG
ncbi:two-component system sensor histidine kinase DesK [Actinocorallia herbida]|uniref:Two-component system sensor histidine kinase DesK n=1 Tax=Actinocorallia herbida TaxID=58109 RepID=A0A3N1D2G6_9ACTN|nr:histidine kinase [Actinocorallia herbida]ROO87727.1 two-component system sensor histidine kinase DesK [Actinocorallia herbida]